MATAWNERTLAQMLNLDPRLRGLAARLSHDAHEADDLVQDAWIAVLTQWPGEPCALEPWAKQVLRNAARKRARRAPPIEWNEEHAAGATGSNGATAFDELARGERAERLRALIGALPEPYRGTLVQRFYAERSVGDIAEQKGIPRATVSTQLRRALARLRAQLARQRDLLPLVFPWSRAARRSRTEPLRPWTGVRAAIGAAGLVAVIPLALAFSTWTGHAHGPNAEVAAQASEGRASEAPQEMAFADRHAVELAESVAAPLVVEARAEVGGAPLAGGRLSVWDESGTLRSCELDEHGRGQLPGLAEARLLVVEVVRSGEMTAGFRSFVRPEAGRIELRVGSGPSVRFTLAGAAGVHPSELQFGLRSSIPGALTSPRLALGPGSSPGEFLAQLPEAFASLSGFDQIDLFVVTSDGLRGAEASIDGRALRLERTLELALEPRATLAVELEPRCGGAIGASRVSIAPEGSAAAWIAAPSAEGRVLVVGLRPGNYHVDAEVAGREPWSSEIELAPGESARLVALAPTATQPQRGPIRGRILRDASGYDGAIVVALEGGRVPQYAQARWVEVADGFEARFEFPGGDAGDLTLRPIPLDGLPTFVPACAPVHSADDSSPIEFEFSCSGRRSVPSIDCDLRADDTLAALERCILEFELPGGTEVEYRLLAPAPSASSRWAVSTHDFRWKVREGSPFDWLDESADIRWRLASPGFATLEGDRSAWATGQFAVALQHLDSAR